MKIGVLALQGAFLEHERILRRLGVEVSEVRLPKDLEGLDGLILPGGESTTIGKLAVTYGLIEPIRSVAMQGKALWGTCAGMILLSKDVHRDQPLLGLMDIVVRRNAFGRQVDSFQIDLDISTLLPEGNTKPFPAVFIRAPAIETICPNVAVLIRLEDGRIVAARQEKLLATSFHPELSNDDRFHRYFLHLAGG